MGASSQSRKNTKWGEGVEGSFLDESAEESGQEPSDDNSESSAPTAEVKSHSIEILHRRQKGRDIKYTVFIENRTVVGICRQHRIAESSQFDFMGCTWSDIPGIVQFELAKELGVKMRDLEAYVDFDSPGVEMD